MKMKQNRMNLARTIAGLLSICLTVSALTQLSGCRLFDNNVSNQIIPGTEEAYDTSLPVGALARDIVSSKHFRRLLVEIQPVQGMMPNQESLNHLREFLLKYTDKPEGFQLETDPPIPPPTHPTGQMGYTIQDVKKIEKENRRFYTVKGTLAVYFLFLDWNSADDLGNNQILGQAYQESSIVIYKNTLNQIETRMINSPQPPAAPWVLEATVMLHEFGHLMGLVDIDGKHPSAHEDKLHLGHCTNKNCLMYWAAETPMAAALSGSQGVPDLDANCQHDLDQLRN